MYVKPMNAQVQSEDVTFCTNEADPLKLCIAYHNKIRSDKMIGARSEKMK